MTKKPRIKFIQFAVLSILLAMYCLPGLTLIKISSFSASASQPNNYQPASGSVEEEEEDEDDYDEDEDDDEDDERGDDDYEEGDDEEDDEEDYD